MSMTMRWSVLASAVLLSQSASVQAQQVPQAPEMTFFVSTFRPMGSIYRRRVAHCGVLRLSSWILLRLSVQLSRASRTGECLCKIDHVSVCRGTAVYLEPSSGIPSRLNTTRVVALLTRCSGGFLAVSGKLTCGQELQTGAAHPGG